MSDVDNVKAIAKALFDVMEKQAHEQRCNLIEAQFLNFALTLQYTGEASVPNLREFVDKQMAEYFKF